MRENLKNVIIGMFFLFVFLPYVSSIYWTSYGNDFTPLWHTSTGGYEGQFDVSVTFDFMGEGYSLGSFTNKENYFPYEPLIWAFNSSENYLIFPNGNNLQVYNSNLFLIEEISTGLCEGQIDLVDFSDLGDLNEVAGLFEFNSTMYQFKTYRYNEETGTFTNSFLQNFPTESDYFVDGVRCQGNKCYYYYSNTTDNYLAWVNSTDYGFIRTGLVNYPVEAPAWFDTDNDGRNEFLVYSSDGYVLIDENGTIQASKNASVSYSFVQVKMFQPDLTNDWRFAVLERNETLSPNWQSLEIYVYREDGSTLWNDMIRDVNTPTYTGATVYSTSARMSIVDDYGTGGDLLDDIYVIGSKNMLQNPSGTSYYAYYVYRGYDGARLLSVDKAEADGNLGYRNNVSLTTADLNDDGYKDFIFRTGLIPTSQYVKIVNGDDGSYINQTDLSSLDIYSCVPADLDFDGFLDVVCSGENGTVTLVSGGVNNNAQIQSVAYFPSTVVSVGETLSATVTAIDSEGDTIYYRHRCSNSEGWSSINTTSVRNCVYSVTGTYNMSVEVRDLFHSDYNGFSQNIIVTETGNICDNDGICEGNEGENYINCPNDCEIPDTTQSSVEGSIPIPTELVSTENINQGLLPEIYYGTLGFMSSVLSPLIVLVFVILFAMIMLVIGVIIKKIALKVGT